MNRIPPDVDRLMWALADNPEPNALDEFERRYPAYVGELGKRIDMVRRMRGTPLKPDANRPVPPFRPVPAAPEWSRPVSAAAFGLLLLALATASYFATRWYLRPEPPSPVPVVEHPRLERPGVPKVVYAPPKRFEAPRPAEPKSETEQLAPLSIRLERVPLSAALGAIAEQAGLKLVLAPGFERIDATVDLDLAEVRPMDAFEMLGRRYGFTAFYQGNREVLVIPAAPSDPSAPEGQPPREGQPAERPDQSPPPVNDLLRTDPLGDQGAEFGRIRCYTAV
jgi:hypothetical protein